MPINEGAFGTLPPHFTAAGLTLLTTALLHKVLPNYASLPAPFKLAVPLLLAQIVYHSDFLKEKLGNGHPLLNTSLFTEDIVGQLKDHVVTGILKCPHTDMQASGVPRANVILHEVKDLASRTTALEATVAAIIPGVRSAIAESQKKATSDLHTMIMSNFQIEGTVAVTQQNMVDTVNQMGEDIKAFMTKLVTPAAPVVAAVPIAPQLPPGWKVFRWQNPRVKESEERDHFLPEDYEPPSVNLSDVYSLWTKGDKSRGIRPLQDVAPRDFKGIPKATQYSRIKNVIKHVVAAAKSSCATFDELTPEEKAIKFNEAYEREVTKVFDDLKDGKEVPEASDLAIGTFYNKLAAWKARQGDDEE